MGYCRGRKHILDYYIKTGIYYIDYINLEDTMESREEYNVRTKRKIQYRKGFHRQC